MKPDPFILSMISRQLFPKIIRALENMPAVALLGARQVGKTTLALHIADHLAAMDEHRKGAHSQNIAGKETAWLDLELDSDLAKLSDPEAYLRRFENKLLIIDEVQRMPDLFRILRGLIDIRKRSGEKSGHFLLLGSSSRDLLQASSETLAGRIRFLELSPFSALEIHKSDPLGFNPDKLWFRGGFPDSYLAPTDRQSWAWRGDFIASYVQRDIPLMGPQVSSTRLKRFWTMLAHYHGQQVVLSELGRSLEVSHTTISSYLDTLTDFYMVRRIPPWSGNTKKRLVKSPKVFIRDSGLLHRLLNISQPEDLLGNPVVGASWEGFVTENILSLLPDDWQYSYYRTQTGVEIDLVLEGPGKQVWAVEIKRSSAPVVSGGFHKASADIGATKKYVVYSGQQRFPMPDQTEAIGLVDFLKLLGSDSDF